MNKNNRNKIINMKYVQECAKMDVQKQHGMCRRWMYKICSMYVQQQYNTKCNVQFAEFQWSAE